MSCSNDADLYSHASSIENMSSLQRVTHRDEDPHLRAPATQGTADAVQLAAAVANKPFEKHHVFLNEDSYRSTMQALDLTRRVRGSPSSV